MELKRVVVTGMGIVSSIGDNVPEVLESLKAGKSGISVSEEMTAYNFRSRAEGRPKVDPFALFDRKTLINMGPGPAWSYVAMLEAIKDSGFTENEYRGNPMFGLLMSSGGPSTSEIVRCADMTRGIYLDEYGKWAIDLDRAAKSNRLIGPRAVPKTMSSTDSANMSVAFGIQGVNNSVTAACSTSALCIRSGCMEIQMGHQNVVFAGGSEELSWTLSNAFDALGAMSTKYNNTPERASRAYDKDRDGFVIAGGAGVLVLEEYDHAKKRGAKIYAEIIGYGHNSDGADMFSPSGEGAERCMKLALNEAKVDRVDYINTHATSTPVGDVKELEAINNVLGTDDPDTKISGTKCLSGHSLGAAGAQESIYTLIMMENSFISPNINVDNLDPAISEIGNMHRALVLNESIDKKIETAISNSFGFGGPNATLVFKKI